MLSLVSCNKAVDQGDIKSPVKEQKRQAEAQRQEKLERRRQEEERRKQEESEALVKTVSEAAVAKLYDAFDQNDSLSEAHAAQRCAMVQSLAREFAQGHSLARAREPMPRAYIDLGYASLGEHMRVYVDELKDRCGNELLFYDGTHGYYPEVMGERLERKEKIRDALQQLPIEDQEECLKLTLLSEQEEFLRGRDIFND